MISMPSYTSFESYFRYQEEQPNILPEEKLLHQENAVRKFGASRVQRMLHTIYQWHRVVGQCKLKWRRP